MQIHISARHIKQTKALRDYVDEKVGRAQRYFDHIVWAQVILEVEKKAHRCEVVIHASRQTFRASATGADLYAAVDLATDRIDSQLKKYKEKIRGHHKDDGVIEAKEIAQRDVLVSVVKEVPLRPMSAEDAADEMERLGFDFWMFQDQDTRQVNVIYRRVDDSYGILQPVKQK